MLGSKAEQAEHVATLELHVAHLRQMNLALAACLRRAKVRSVRDGQLRTAVLTAHDAYVADALTAEEGAVL